MGRFRRLGLILAAATPALLAAAGPGAAEGTLSVGPERIVLARAMAHLHDNAEGTLDFKRELRILLTDRELPGEALQGLEVVFGLGDRVREGKVRGLLIRIDPDDLHHAAVTLLYPPRNAGASLVNQTLEDTARPVLKRLSVTDAEVEGEVEGHAEGEFDPDFPQGDYRIVFRAPLTREPAVTGDLKGPAARQSPQVKALLELARLQAKGDSKGASAFMTEAAASHHEAQMKAMGPQAPAMARQYGQEMLKVLPKAQRVVVRGDRAAVMADGYTMHLVRVGGAWKLD